METEGIDAVYPLAEKFRRPPEVWARLRRLIWQQPLGTAGAVFLMLVVIVAIVAEFIAPYDPFEMRTKDALLSPGAPYWLGTDQYGRDVLSRVIHGSRISLAVGLGSVAIVCSVGTIIGVVSGYFMGKVDAIIQRVMDSLMAFPTLILSIAIVAVLGISLPNVIIAVAISYIPRDSRVVRGATIAIKENQYIEAARAIGCSPARIIFWHIMPNIFAPVIVIASLTLATAIMAEASLSFLGYGIPQPLPSWGGMMSIEGRRFIEAAPWIALFPGTVLTATVLAFNFLGDSLRDILDPRLRV